MELPERGISLSDLQQTTALLLRSGASIAELNTVRACLSQVKAGGLARAAGGATVLCLALSDVLGNPLSVIGSGPCLETVRDRTRALDILQARGVAESVPDAVLALLRTAASEPGQSAQLTMTHVILGDIWTALEAAREAAEAEGLKPAVLTGWLEGEAREVGRVFGALARDLPRVQEETGIDCYIAGGETTVTVRGPGKGGRSQELACCAAMAMSGIADVALLAAGTDGTDGPTDAAGAIVDGGTASLAQAAGCDLSTALRENDTYPALAAAGSLLITGPTNSNVGDIVVIVKRET
jgi:hydroxypyruvate reductase